MVASKAKWRIPAKRDFPVADIRQYLEPGPVVLVSSAWRDETNIMTMGWHMVMEFSPSLIGCIIANSNHSFDMVRKSKECVINIPSLEMADAVVGIGNCDGDAVQKFAKFGLTPMRATKVKAPLIGECFANFECRLHDARMVNKYNFFVWEVVKSHVARSPKLPRTLHYHGQGLFTTDGKAINKKAGFTKWKGQANF